MEKRFFLSQSRQERREKTNKNKGFGDWCREQGRLSALADVEKIIDKLSKNIWGEPQLKQMYITELKQEIAKLKSK